MMQLFVSLKTAPNDRPPQTNDSHQHLLERLSTHTSASNITTIRVDFQPECGVAKAFAAPVTEVATFYYEDAPPDTAFEGATILLEALQNDVVNIMGWAFGTTHEVIEKEGIKGRGTVLVVGRESVEAHEESHSRQALKDNIHRLTTPEVKGLEMHHVRANAYHGE